MYDSNGYIPPVKVETLTMDVSIIRSALITMKVIKSIRGLLTNDPEPEMFFTPEFVSSVNFICSSHVLLNLSFAIEIESH